MDDVGYSCALVVVLVGYIEDTTNLSVDESHGVIMSPVIGCVDRMC